MKGLPFFADSRGPAARGNRVLSWDILEICPYSSFSGDSCFIGHVHGGSIWLFWEGGSFGLDHRNQDVAGF
jgi:hypothetical protein